MSDASEPTKEELRQQARAADLPTSGTKEELKERLATVGADESDTQLVGGAIRSEASNEADRMAQKVRESGPSSVQDV